MFPYRILYIPSGDIFKDNRSTIMEFSSIELAEKYLNSVIKIQNEHFTSEDYPPWLREEFDIFEYH